MKNIVKRSNTKTTGEVTSTSGGQNNIATMSQGSRSRCHQRITFHPGLGYDIPPPIPAKVAKRNLRERKRVQQVNTGFDMLRNHVPTAAKHKKMSKVETLRHAVDYILSLESLLSGTESGSQQQLPEEQRPPTDQSYQQSPHLGRTSPQSIEVPPPPSLMVMTPCTSQALKAYSPYDNIPPHQREPSQAYQGQSSLPHQHFQYPAPLTPVTPTSKSDPFSESGYGSVSTPNPMCNIPYGSIGPATQQSYSSMKTPDSLSPSPSSATVSPPSMFITDPNNITFTGAPSYVGWCSQQPNSDHFQRTDTDPQHFMDEEDELLDVITKWQDQE